MTNLTEWLSNQNYKITKNVTLGGKLPDLVGYTDKEIVSFEEKSYAEELPLAIGQCLHYLVDSNKAFIVLPPEEIKRVNPITLEILKIHGLGLLEKDKESIRVIIDAQIFEKNVNQLLDIINSTNKSNEKRKIKENVHYIDKQDILDLLRKNKTGLTIREISKSLNTSRHTISRYVFALKEVGDIKQQDIGRAKVFTLKWGYKK